MTAAHPFRRVGVLMGGMSAERDVSLRSGAAVVQGLTDAGYEAVPIDLKTATLTLPPGIEAVFIALHGAFGEDGQIQTLLNRAGIPYTGSGAEASRRAFDKTQAKRVFVEAGIPTPEYEVLRSGQPRTLTLPVVVKPASQGSSLGVHRVFDEAQWEPALRDALSYWQEAVVERYIPGRELTVGVVDKTALPIVEIVAENDWYDYTAKYTKGHTIYQPPRDMAEDADRACRRWGLEAFRALGCRGFARTDLRMAPDGQLYVLEVNSIPGFTETSLLPKAAAWAGQSFATLCDTIMRLADGDCDTYDSTLP